MFYEVIFTGIAIVVKGLIIWKVPLLSVNPAFKMF